MIELNKVTHLNYTLVFDGNGIENQMLIVLSTGQDGGMAVRLVYSIIDNSSIIPETKTAVFVAKGLQAWRKNSEAVYVYLTEQAALWISRGLPGDTAPSIKKANAAIKQFLMV
jgi:hypothetical protein